jgi:hypothetical protein
MVLRWPETAPMEHSDFGSAGEAEAQIPDDG